MIKKLKELGVTSYKCAQFEVSLSPLLQEIKPQSAEARIKSELKNIPTQSITDELYKDLDQKINRPVLSQTV